jgi:putative serine protease PepD
MDSSALARSRAWVLPGVVMLAVATAATACSSTGTKAVSFSRHGVTIGTHNAAIALQDEYEQTVEAVLPSVVQISTKDSTGSGVVYDSSGDIVTNEHVVGKAKTVQVRDAAGNQVLTADVVGEFAPDDLAVVRVTKNASSLKPAKFANSDSTMIGEIVLAMGNPLGLTDSVTQGIVSATGRTVSANEEGGAALITAAIQTSAAINPGNSGGALVDLDDEVIGIPTLAARDPQAGGAAPGIGFAIPSNTVQNIAEQLIKTGKVTRSDRASLQITAETAADPAGNAEGVAVTGVAAGGAGAKAGLKAGDVIVGINDQGTPTLQILESTLSALKPGDKVKLHVKSNGSVRIINVTLGSLGS